MVIANHQREDFRLFNLHPKVITPFQQLITAIGAEWWNWKGYKARFEPLEGFRHPARQNYLLTGTKNTKAGPWQSAHQYGMAVDFAMRIYHDDETAVIGQQWYWPENIDWEMLAEFALHYGLKVPIKWDRGHVVHPLWDQIRKTVT